MATFTYTPWVTGEVITADKLNGHNCKLVLTQEDVENGFEIIISTGLSTEDFLGMIVKSYNNISKVIRVTAPSPLQGWLVLNTKSKSNIYYDPTTGILQLPDQDEEEQ